MKSHTFRTKSGRKRRYRVTVDETLDGMTEVPDKAGEKRTYELRVNADLSPFQAFETALHESTHAIDPDASEEYVTNLTHEQARFVWRYLKARDMLK